ncbi:hypothetical protein [Poriferisphaera corsica]|uniref:hypothetical protein n=1 Tax=Poriferisphaera corsica TaxID=2528020 RepID=UPI0011A8355F|nr:hypothetical protein [Poriferisphaera corsica]
MTIDNGIDHSGAFRVFVSSGEKLNCGCVVDEGLEKMGMLMMPSVYIIAVEVGFVTVYAK